MRYHTHKSFSDLLATFAPYTPQILRFPRAERGATRLPLGASAPRQNLPKRALPLPRRCLAATAPAPLPTLQITPFHASRPLSRFPMTRLWTIAPCPGVNTARAPFLATMGGRVKPGHDSKGWTAAASIEAFNREHQPIFALFGSLWLSERVAQVFPCEQSSFHTVAPAFFNYP